MTDVLLNKYCSVYASLNTFKNKKINSYIFYFSINFIHYCTWFQVNFLSIRGNKKQVQVKVKVDTYTWKSSDSWSTTHLCIRPYAILMNHLAKPNLISHQYDRYIKVEFTWNEFNLKYWKMKLINNFFIFIWLKLIYVTDFDWREYIEKKFNSRKMKFYLFGSWFNFIEINMNFS